MEQAPKFEDQEQKKAETENLPENLLRVKEQLLSSHIHSIPQKIGGYTTEVMYNSKVEPDMRPGQVRVNDIEDLIMKLTEQDGAVHYARISFWDDNIMDVDFMTEYGALSFIKQEKGK